MGTTIKFDKATVATIAGAEYLMLSLPDYEAKVKARKFSAEAPDKPHVAEIKQFRKKRSLDANARCWALCQKLSEVLGLTKEEVYIRHIREVGPFAMFDLVEEAIGKFTEAWRLGRIGWIVDVLDDSLRPGYKKVAAYYGSSSYNAAEMSRLINSIADECRAQGIETLSPEELKSLLGEWEDARAG